MVRLIMKDGSKQELSDVYAIQITSQTLLITLQHPEDDAYIYDFELSEVAYMYMSEPKTIKFNVEV